MDWAGIISAIGTIILGFFTYNQYTRNKMTDLKVEQYKNEDKKKNKRRSDNAMRVYEELWNILFALKCDRVYIIQPHPLGNEEMISIYFEVKKRTAEAMKPRIHEVKIAEAAKFAGMLEKSDFKYITDIEKQVPDRYAQSIFCYLGSKNIALKRLSDNRHDWVGSLVCEFHNNMEIDEKETSHILNFAATNIQFIIPEIED